MITNGGSYKWIGSLPLPERRWHEEEKNLQSSIHERSCEREGNSWISTIFMFL